MHAPSGESATSVCSTADRLHKQMETSNYDKFKAIIDLDPFNEHVRCVRHYSLLHFQVDAAPFVVNNAYCDSNVDTQLAIAAFLPREAYK